MRVIAIQETQRRSPVGRTMPVSLREPTQPGEREAPSTSWTSAIKTE